jgi:hypothetical protein
MQKMRMMPEAEEVLKKSWKGCQIRAPGLEVDPVLPEGLGGREDIRK